jgi:hypothetical protein
LNRLRPWLSEDMRYLKDESLMLVALTIPWLVYPIEDML